MSATAVAIGLAACGSASGEGSGGAGSASDRLAGLSAAIDATNMTRSATSAALAQADAAVTTADSADELALAGDRAGAATPVSTAAAAVGTATAAAIGTSADASAYTAAIGRLGIAEAAAPLSRAQHAAVAQVVSAGRAEAASFESAAAAYAAVWPTYTAVVGLERTWYAHANAGWFATAQEAGGAYQVARQPQLPSLTAAQQRLSAVDAQRRAASTPMQAALDAARTALASLT